MKAVVIFILFLITTSVFGQTQKELQPLREWVSDSTQIRKAKEKRKRLIRKNGYAENTDAFPLLELEPPRLTKKRKTGTIVFKSNKNYRYQGSAKGNDFIVSQHTNLKYKPGETVPIISETGRFLIYADRNNYLKVWRELRITGNYNSRPRVVNTGNFFIPVVNGDCFILRDAAKYIKISMNEDINNALDGLIFHEIDENEFRCLGFWEDVRKKL